MTANAGELFVGDDRGLIGSNYIVTAVTADDYQVDPRAITISVPQSIRRDETLTLTANTALDEVTLTGGTLASGERLGLYFDGVMIGEMVRVEDPPGSGSFVLRPTASTTATVQQIVDARQGTGLLQVASFDANGAILPDFARRYAVTFADGRQTSDLQGTFGVFDAGLGDITFTTTTATSDLFLDPPEAPAPLVIRDSSGSQPMTAVLYNELFSDTASPAMTRFLQDKADAIDGAVGAGSLLSRTLRDYANGTITGTRFNEIVGAERDGMGTIVGLMGDFALSLASLGPDEITEAERQLLLRLNLRTRELGYEFADSLRANIEADTARRTMQNSTLVGVFSAARFGDPLGDTISGFSEAHAAGMVAALNPDGDAVAVAAATGIGVFTGVAAGGTAGFGGAIAGLATATSVAAAKGGSAAVVSVSAAAIAGSSGPAILTNGVAIHATSGLFAGMSGAGAGAAVVGGIFVAAAAITTAEAVQQVLAEERENVANATLDKFESGYSYSDAPDFLRMMALREMFFGGTRSNTTMSRREGGS